MGYFENLSLEKQNVLQRHLELVLKANEKTNLTRISSAEQGTLLHIEDSLCGLPEIEDAPEGLYGDLGTGAGFPGIPIAVATGRKTVLVDPRKKKMDVIDGILKELDLSPFIETYAGRAELLARKKPGSFAVLTARALSKLSVLMELASPLLMKGGRLVCYKSSVEEGEMADALRVQKLVGMRMLSNREFDLEGYERRIITFEKSGKPQVKLPRLEGQAQKNPL